MNKKEKNGDKDIVSKTTEKMKKKAKDTINDYKKFAIKGNAIELAIGVVIGSAFTNIVNSIVSCVITPVISLLTNRVDISNLFIALDGNKYATIEAAKEAGAAIITYGMLINSVINFLILSTILYIMVKYITAMRNKMEHLDKKEEIIVRTTKNCPFCLSEINILATRCPHCTSTLEDCK